MPGWNLEPDSDTDTEESSALDVMSALHKRNRSPNSLPWLTLDHKETLARKESSNCFVTFSTTPNHLSQSAQWPKKSFNAPNPVSDALLTYENGLISVQDLIFVSIKYELIFGITWLHDINPVIDWKTNTLAFPRLPLPTLTPATTKPRPSSWPAPWIATSC
jgi:hypothetical protein